MSVINSSMCLTLLENNPSFIIIIDEQQSIYWLNQSFCDFLGLEREDLLGRSMIQVNEPCMKHVLDGRERVELFAGVLNKWIELQETMMIKGGKAEVEPEQELRVCYYRDASKEVQREQQLLQLESTLSHKMSHDPVTGMLNHYSLYQTLNSEVSRCRRYNNPLSLILMNVDYQSTSDSLSPDSLSLEKYEQTRLMISQLLKDQMRWADIVGHDDNFDFVLLLPETHYDSAEILAKKLNKSLQEASPDRIKLSFGISEWQKGDDVQLFMGRAAENFN